MVWRPQMVLFPHNHEMWTVVGIYTGREDNIFWRKDKDDPHGLIEAAGAKALSEGEATSLGRDVIHSVSNPIPRFTGALHIYGGDFFADGRSQWDPETLHQAPLDMQGLRDRFAGE
jgi:predicted metal-dependent enzyme (double-stranded beta helix superfamily)